MEATNVGITTKTLNTVGADALINKFLKILPPSNGWHHVKLRVN